MHTARTHTQGAAAVASVLSGNHSVYKLSLAGCPLRDEGAMALAEALKVNISLYRLDLSNCLVGGCERGRRACLLSRRRTGFWGLSVALSCLCARDAAGRHAALHRLGLRAPSRSRQRSKSTRCCPRSTFLARPSVS